MNASTLLLLGTVLLSFATLTWSLHRWPIWGICLFTGERVWEGLHAEVGALLDIGVGGIGLLPSDVIALGLLASALVRAARDREALRGGAPLTALLVLLLLTGFSLLRGTLLYGLQTSGNDARAAFLQVCCVLLYVSTVPDPAKALRAVFRCWLVGAVVLCALAAAQWRDVGLGSTTDIVFVDGVRSDSRPLGSPEGLFIAQAAVMLLCGTCATGRARWLVWPFLCTIVLLQHRSAWLAAAVMLTGLLLSHRAGSRSRLLAVTGAVALASGGLLALALGLGEGVWESLTASGTDDRTLLWRYSGWLELLSHLRGPLDWLLGLPFGSGYTRLMKGVLVTLSPHNFYVHLLLRVGLVGVGALCVLYASVWRGTAAHPDGPLLRLLVLGQVTFLVTNTFYPEQAVLLGLVIACARRAPATLPGRPSTPDAPAPPVPQELSCIAGPR
ncbi:O-antigen ligase [Streptomyces sp. V1I6]|uniref:O-antigen ligase family protein n=1 Tax=Streptomyces sp. V1I6 TaxID=3042273 RepID=UPI002786F141|nr:hypothetical protein [Streptomyces sp. V1I6]MDQ0844825.1 hypothetical protein [Streptomyces sp. V1I6]